MVLFFILLFAVAVVDWVAVAKNWKRIEYIAKPATMVLLLIWLGLAGLDNIPLACFALGIFFSLAGDVSLMVSYARFSENWFILGLAAFLLAHVSYIIGLNVPLPKVSLFWSLAIALILALTAVRLLRRIIDSIRQKGLKRMAFPVGLYGAVITLMLLSALLTLSNLDWRPSASILVASGAFLFYLSDSVLAWNKFVTPIRNGRLINMILYHLGQIALVAGAVVQFGQ
jgi:alkenylglycerophosphocholine/alkenylglycerophosphoethanolamine hydrolase